MGDLCLESIPTAEQYALVSKILERFSDELTALPGYVGYGVCRYHVDATPLAVLSFDQDCDLTNAEWIETVKTGIPSEMLAETMRVGVSVLARVQDDFMFLW